MALLAGPAAMAGGAELEAKTLAAFERYVRGAEARMASDTADPARFLLVDRKPATERTALLSRLRAGEIVMERLREREAGRDIDVPGGLLHHWAGTAFLPGVRVPEAVALMQDYDRHSRIFAPAVVRSSLLARDGDRFRVALRFHMKKIVAVTVDTENDARFTTFEPGRVASAIRSVRVQEVDQAGTPAERLEPDGQGGGYMWRLNTYWRYLERDGGTYVQCESLTFTMEALRKALLER